MKKLFCLILPVAMCISFAACGSKGTGNADHDYVIALMEKGDYDMAITVLEHLRDKAAANSGQAAAESEAAKPEQAETTVEVPQPTSTPVSSSEQLAIDAVNDFLAEKGNDMIEAFRTNTGNNSGPVSVSHVTEYFMPDCDNNGNDANCILVNLMGGFCADSAIFDSMQLLLDLDTGKLYDSTELDWDLMAASNGEPGNEEVFNMYVLNAYYNIVSGGDPILWSGRETRANLSADQIARINEMINK